MGRSKHLPVPPRTDTEGIHFYRGALRAVFTVPAANTLAATHDQWLPFLNGDVGTEFLVALWQLRIPEDGDVWLR